MIFQTTVSPKPIQELAADAKRSGRKLTIEVDVVGRFATVRFSDDPHGETLSIQATEFVPKEHA